MAELKQVLKYITTTPNIIDMFSIKEGKTKNNLFFFILKNFYFILKKFSKIFYFFFSYEVGK